MNLNYPLLIDGGLSNVLEAKGYDLNHPLWSAKLIDENPAAIVQAHVAYLNAGAQVIITASYQASIKGLVEAGYCAEKAVLIVSKTVQLAAEAIDITGKNALIAASIGPYGAYLSDGSEYAGNYVATDDEIRAFHGSRIKILAESAADIFACETIPSFREARIIAELLKGGKKQAWLSFSCKDGKHINDGTPISDCVAYFKNHPNLFAIGINCTKPEFASSLISEIKPNSGDKKIIVYPNSGEIFEASNKTWYEDPQAQHFCELTRDWIEQGADIVGGCCRIGPEDIAAIYSDIIAQ